MVERVSAALGLDARVHVEKEEERIRVVLEGNDLGLFIGRHGQTIDAVQHLAFKAATRDTPSTLPATAPAASRRCTARPTRRPRRRSTPAGPSPSTR